MAIAASSAISDLPTPTCGAAEFFPEQPTLYQYQCGTCGQAVDSRHLGEVLHHEVPNHQPIPTGRVRVIRALPACLALARGV